MVDLFNGLALVHVRTTAQCGHGGGRARRKATEQSQRGPVAHPAGATLLIAGGDELARKLDHVVEQLPILGAESVGFLLIQPLGKGGVGVQEVADVRTTALDQVKREFLAEAFARIEFNFGGKILEFTVQQTQESAEGLFISAVGGGGDQDDVALR